MLNHILIRLAVYYAAGFLFFGGLFQLFPKILYYIAQERVRHSGGKSLDFQEGVAAPLGQGIEGIGRVFDPATAIPVLMALILTFVLTVPITWTYRWTRPRKRYNQAFAHTLLVVPIAIALIVFLVKGSLALAFSLAGIVAAVQFRTSLKEPMDSVYMFIVIGIGLAAGVQLVSVAFLASLVFVAIALGVWKTDFGAQPAVLSGWRIHHPGASGQLLGVSGVVQPGVAAEDGASKKSYNAQLQMHTTNADAAQAATPILDANTKRWRVAQVIRKEDGTSTVVFDVRLKKSVDLSTFIQEIEKVETSARVEFQKHKS